MKQSSQNTMGEGLQKLLGDIAQMQAYPDADMEFLTNLQGMVVGKIRASLGGQQPGGAGQPGQPGQPTPEMAQGSPGAGGMPSGPSPMSGPAMGLSATGGTGNLDELTRMLGGASQAG